MAGMYLPSVGGQLTEDAGAKPYQSSPLLNTYSPRLFGAPPQLTNLNDMRLSSAPQDNSTTGPVGNFYLTKVLQEAQVCNFVVGRALFTGGMQTFAGIISMMIQYTKALSTFKIYGESDKATGDSSNVRQQLDQYANLETYKKAMEDDANSDYNLGTKLSDYSETEEGGLDISSNSDASASVNALGNLLGNINGSTVAGEITAVLLDSLKVNQPFYTFDSDWYTYINNVKMMINTAVIQLGLQKSCVKIGDALIPIGMEAKVTPDTDVWSRYHWITRNKNLGTITGIDTQTGDTSQYVSFMIDPTSTSESYSNSVGESQIYSSVINAGDSIGKEIAFLTGSSTTSLDDGLIQMAGDVTNAAEAVLTNLTMGVGRFTASIAGAFARSFVGDHTIYPQVFQQHTSTSSKDITIHLNSSGGDPYSFLTELMVPTFFVLGMVLPNMAKNNPAAYAYPPVVQMNIPGIWGTRLGMVTSVTITKNSSGKDISVNGYPTSIDISMTVTDLQHTLVTSGMNMPAAFLNNHTMYDYIAHCAGVDKYRVNGSIRLVSRLALASSFCGNILNNIGSAVLNDFTSFANRLSGVYRL